MSDSARKNAAKQLLSETSLRPLRVLPAGLMRKCRLIWVKVLSLLITQSPVVSITLDGPGVACKVHKQEGMSCPNTV